MNKFNKLKQKYDSLIKEALADNRDILIKSFL